MELPHVGFAAPQGPDKSLHLAGGEPQGPRHHVVRVIPKYAMEDFLVTGKSGVYRAAELRTVLVVAPPAMVRGGATGQPAKEVEVGALYPVSKGLSPV